jgi:hypothetical protein
MLQSRADAGFCPENGVLVYDPGEQPTMTHITGMRHTGRNRRRKRLQLQADGQLSKRQRETAAAPVAAEARRPAILMGAQW